MYDHPQTTPIIPQPLIYAACDSGAHPKETEISVTNMKTTSN